VADRGRLEAHERLDLREIRAVVLDVVQQERGAKQGKRDQGGGEPQDALARSGRAHPGSDPAACEERLGRRGPEPITGRRGRLPHEGHAVLMKLAMHRLFSCRGRLPRPPRRRARREEEQATCHAGNGENTGERRQFRRDWRA
jgi:hypothetical protein